MERPQGLIIRKNERSVETLRARPWRVTQRRSLMPMAQIFEAVGRSVDPDAGAGAGADGLDVEGGEGLDDDVFEEAEVGVEVEFVEVEVEDGVGNELAWAVEGDIAAAVGFDKLDAAGFEEGGRGEEVALSVGAAADGDDGGVLDEHEGTGGEFAGEDGADGGRVGDPRRAGRALGRR